MYRYTALILILALVVGEFSSLLLNRLYPEEISQIIRCIRGYVGHTICITLGRKGNVLHVKEIETGFFNCPVLSFYTN